MEFWGRQREESSEKHKNKSRGFLQLYKECSHKIGIWVQEIDSHTADPKKISEVIWEEFKSVFTSSLSRHSDKNLD